MKLGLDGTTTRLIYRLGVGRSLLVLMLGLLISGAAFELALFPTTRAIYIWARLLSGATTTDGIITDQYAQGKQSYLVTYAYTLHGGDGTVRRFTNEEYVEEHAFFQLNVGRHVLVKYSISHPSLARLADNAYVPWISFFFRELVGLVFFLLGIWLIFCALGAWVVSVRRRRRTRAEVALWEQEFRTLDQKGYVRITYQMLWAQLFFKVRKYTQAARYIVFREGELYLSLDFIQDAREREQAQSYIAQLNAGGKPDPWLSMWLSRHLDALGTQQSRR